MAKHIILNDNLLVYLDKLADFNGLSLGLIIGQFSGGRHYAVHLAPTPEQSKEECLPGLEDVDEGRIGEHARYVTRMLPGGLNVLGVFFVCPDNLFTQSNTLRIKKVWTAIEKSINNPYSLDAHNLVDSYFILHYNPITKKYICMSCDRQASGEYRNTDCKFQDTSKTWAQIDTQYILRETFFERSLKREFRQQLENIISKVDEDVGRLIVFLQEKEWEPGTTIFNILKISKSTSLQASLFRPSQNKNSLEFKISNCEEQMIVKGTLPCRVFMHTAATTHEVAQAVRQDITRSISAKLEMHWDSLVDEADSSPEEKERVHVPPHRVLFRPNGWSIQLSDFLFPGEDISQTIQTCRELLDVELDRDNIDNFEIVTDGRDLLSEDSIKISSKEEKSLLNGIVFPHIYIGLVVVGLALALVAHFMLRLT